MKDRNYFRAVRKIGRSYEDQGRFSDALGLYQKWSGLDWNDGNGWKRRVERVERKLRGKK